MTASRFRFTRSFSAWPSRRIVLLLLAIVLVLGSFPLPVLLPGAGFGGGQTVEAKRDNSRQKQDRKGKGRDRPRHKAQAAAAPNAACDFTQTGTTWKLKANCTITAPINIPAGVTLDGNNKTITMTGPTVNYRQNVPDNWRVEAGILANGGTANVRNLKLTGSGLTGQCFGNFPEGIAFINTSGAIEKVTVTDIRLDGPPTCGAGISATGTGGQHVTIRDVTVSGSTSRQLWGNARLQTAGITVDISEANLTVVGGPNAGGDGITFLGPVSGAIDNVNVDVQTVQGNGIRVVNTGSPIVREVTIRDIAVSGLGNSGIIAGAFSSAPILSVDIDRATVNWQRIDPSAAFGGEMGIRYFGGVSGTVSRSSVRNTTFAGISIQDGAEIALERNDVKKGFIGVLATAGSDVTLDDATIEDVLGGVIAIDPGTAVAVSDGTITGGKAGPDQAFGILYQRDASGSIDDTSVSRFFDTNPDTVSCGIGLADDAGPVAIGHVSYRPGNEQNLCDPVVFQIFRRGGEAAPGAVALSNVALSAEALTAQAEAITDADVTLDRTDQSASANEKADPGQRHDRGKRGKR